MQQDQKKIHSNQLFEIEKVLLCGKVSLNLIKFIDHFHFLPMNTNGFEDSMKSVWTAAKPNTMCIKESAVHYGNLSLCFYHL